MSIHQVIHDTLDREAGEVAELIGAGDVAAVERRREVMRAFLAEHPWDEAAYKDWLRDGRYQPKAPPPAWDVSHKSRGFGDTVAKLTSAVGVKPCGGCKQRQAALNKLMPYKEKQA